MDHHIWIEKKIRKEKEKKEKNTRKRKSEKEKEREKCYSYFEIEKEEEIVFLRWFMSRSLWKGNDFFLLSFSFFFFLSIFQSSNLLHGVQIYMQKFFLQLFFLSLSFSLSLFLFSLKIDIWRDRKKWKEGEEEVNLSTIFCIPNHILLHFSPPFSLSLSLSFSFPLSPSFSFSLCYSFYPSNSFSLIFSVTLFFEHQLDSSTKLFHFQTPNTPHFILPSLSLSLSPFLVFSLPFHSMHFWVVRQGNKERKREGRGERRMLHYNVWAEKREEERKKSALSWK